jgi:TetR/AcrR family fatty acid metabolism transcriptional regulator
MGGRNKRIRKKVDRYEEIIMAAFDVFIKKGFHQAKMEEIAQKAGIGKGTIYEYFRSKKELFCGMVKQWMTWYCNSIEKEASRGKDFKEKLENMMRAHMEFATQTKNLANILLNDHIYISKDLHLWMIESKERIVKLVEGVLLEGIKEEKLRRIDVHLAALMFLASWRVFVVEGIDGTGKKNLLEEIKEKTMDILLYGIANEAL